jgi:hypothetical protein
MEIKFENPLGLNEKEVDAIVAKIAISPPIAIMEFLRKHSGAIPRVNDKLCGFKIVHPDAWVDENFIEQIATGEQITFDWQNRDTLEMYVKHFELSENFVQIEYLILFALAANGALYVAIDGMHLGKVYFSDNGDFGILQLADSFDAFWGNVYAITNDDFV